MINWIIIGILVLIIGSISLYIYKAKKSGQKCIGCPYAKQCGAKGCSCSGEHRN